MPPSSPSKRQAPRLISVLEFSGLLKAAERKCPRTVSVPHGRCYDAFNSLLTYCFERFGSGLTSENFNRLRGRVGRLANLTPPQVNTLTLPEFTALLTKATRNIRRIHPSHQTRPMSLREAARHMGYGSSKDAAEKLRAAIESDAVGHQKRTRQQHIFDRRDFPSEVWQKIIPN